MTSWIQQESAAYRGLNVHIGNSHGCVEMILPNPVFAVVSSRFAKVDSSDLDIALPESKPPVETAVLIKPYKGLSPSVAPLNGHRKV